MQSDGAVLPDLVETVVLHRLGLVRTDDLPGLAARWLASDTVDSDSVRRLVGHDAHDPWVLDELLDDALTETHGEVPRDPATVQQVAVAWVSNTWRLSGDTRWAVWILAYLGLTHLDDGFDLGFFIGLDDEWGGGWGRSVPELRRAAEQVLGSSTPEGT